MVVAYPCLARIDRFSNQRSRSIRSASVSVIFIGILMSPHENHNSFFVRDVTLVQVTKQLLRLTILRFNLGSLAYTFKFNDYALP